MTGADLYLRDLKEYLQDEYIRAWKETGKEKLLKAFKDGQDIKIGEYCDNGKEEVSE